MEDLPTGWKKDKEMAAHYLAVIGTIIDTLEKYGINNVVLEKARINCPEQLEEMERRLAAIDVHFHRFLRMDSSLVITLEEWNQFMSCFIMPLFNSGVEIITRVNGKLKGE